MRSPDPTDESPHDSGAPSPQVKGRSGEALIGIVATCRFAEAVAIGMLVPILPLFLVNLDPEAHGLLDAWIGTASFSHEEQTAILFSAAGFAMAAIQIASGRISDAFDMRKPLILFGLGGGTLCAASLLILDSFGELLLARVLLGIFMGLTFPPLMAIIAHHSPEGRGGRTLGIYSSIRLLGFAGGPLLGAWISENWGYTTAFATSSFLLATSVLTVGLWVPEHKDGRKRGPGEPKHVLPPVPFTQRLLGSGIFLMMVGISAMISLFPTYQREYGASDQELGLVFSVFIGARFLLQYPLGYLGD
ncbi:MAG: MFS transporter, partial [Planctomycetota bacterium]